MSSKTWQRIIFGAGMLGVAGPELVTALDDYKITKTVIRIVCALALAFVVQAKGQTQKQDGA